MKTPAILLAGSLAANLAFAALFALRPAFAPTSFRAMFDGGSSQRAAADTARREEQKAEAARQVAALAAAAKPPASLWESLQTDDLNLLATRLREAGFPASAVRGIISAKIVARTEERLTALTRSIEQTPFWKPNVSSATNPKVLEERQQIYRERNKLLREVLGPDALTMSGGDPSMSQRRQYGDLPKAKVELVQRVEEDYAELMSQVRAATQGITLPEDRTKLALLEREKRTDIAAILTPEEMADYEVRTSVVTSRLRTALTLMDATEQEFRAIYAVQQPLADQLYPMAPTLVAGIQQRRDLTEAMEAQVKAALGEARAAEFIRSSNYEFQQLASIAQRENLPPTAAVQAFELRNAISDQSAKIGSDSVMSPEEKREALRTLAKSGREKINAVLGAGGASYTQSAQWLKAIESGSVVTFSGTTTSFRSINSGPN